MTYNPLLFKLQHLVHIDQTDQSALRFGARRSVEAGRDIITQDSRISHTTLLLSGMACRYKMLPSGQRAIVGFLVPGDFTNCLFSESQRVDFAVAAMPPCEVADVSCSALRRIAADNKSLSTAFRAFIQMDQAIQRTWIANLGQSAADKRTAHLLCELRQRFAMVGLANDHGFRLFATQQDLADALGLSVVHVNRTLQHLKALGLIIIANHMVSIPNLGGLETFAGFDPHYLIEDYGLHDGEATFTPPNFSS
jgi:CRP-like cAMP-binding protein